MTTSSRRPLDLTDPATLRALAFDLRVAADRYTEDAVTTETNTDVDEEARRRLALQFLTQAQTARDRAEQLEALADGEAPAPEYARIAPLDPRD